VWDKRDGSALKVIVPPPVIIERQAKYMRRFGIRGVSGSLLPAGKFEAQFQNQCQYAVMPVKSELPHFKGLSASFGGTDETVGW